ncbi:hypothetical protein L596_004391 [Steinernema carpocapsae]|uniref:STAC3-related SH3 domain-containing protein n=1 Tax=Steinernema carpocapsae TaxID=34508 RepID=A0A4U8UVS2_STECR|nr:hypothetical protein L596_004391 [Steinernema carpocapsae]
MSSRRASLPPTPFVFGSTAPHRPLPPTVTPERRGRLYSRPSQPTLHITTTYPSAFNPCTHRASQPAIEVHFDVDAKQSRESPVQPLLYYRDHVNTHSPKTMRKLPKASEKRILKRATQSDLAFRFQKHNEPAEAISNSTEEVLDPVYLALKQATGKYGRRGSSAHNFGESASPSPRNLSQVSLQDSGYAETSSSQGQLLGSTPQLDMSGSSSRRRAPKLNKQMKSLSLDCAEMPPPVNSALRSPFRSKPTQRTPGRGYAGSGEMSDWERSCSPNVPSPRRLPSSPAAPPQPSKTRKPPSHIVIHEYLSGDAGSLYLGDRMHIVDNGDPDWLHGFKDGDRLEQLITFPSTCVAQVHVGEQPMRITQNVHIPDSKLRLYRDQVVFAQADSIRDGRVLVRNEHNAFANCPLQYLTLL